jgi:hypothetical protein
MFSMTIVFGASPVPWTLLFRTQEAFNNAIIVFKNPPTFESDYFDITDDYGQHVSVKRGTIQGVMFEDLTKSRLAHIERGLHQMRTQIDANNLAKSDPVLMAAMRSQQVGPGVITPFGANGAFRQ